MSRIVLFILTSVGELGANGQQSGSWLEEVAAPYWRLVDAGYQVAFASPKGAQPPIDPMSLNEPWISEAGRRFGNDPAASAILKDALKLDEVNPALYDGVYLVGGAATTWDFPHNRVIKRIVESYTADNKIVSAICHGVVGLVGAVDLNGEPLVKGRDLTAISNAEDAMMGLDDIVPILPEDVLRKLRANYTCAAPLAEHVVVDALFITGQNPASADLLARTILLALQDGSGNVDVNTPERTIIFPA